MGLREGNGHVFVYGTGAGKVSAITHMSQALHLQGINSRSRKMMLIGRRMKRWGLFKPVCPSTVRIGN